MQSDVAGIDFENYKTEVIRNIDRRERSTSSSERLPDGLSGGQPTPPYRRGRRSTADFEENYYANGRAPDVA